MTIEQRISKGRVHLLLDHPFFGALAMHLVMQLDDSIQTFNVDGTTMRYNPEFANSLTDAEITAVIAHEVMHCALLHIFRRNGRDPELWNEAADYAINLELIKAGLKLPKDCLLDSKYAGLSAEVIYAQLQRQKQQQPKQSKDSQQQPTGTFSDAPQGQDGNDGQPEPKDASNGQPEPRKGMSEQDWKIAAEQAARVSKKAGKFSSDIERAIQQARQSKTDWRQELREFLEQTTPSDYSWQVPNRRFIQAGLYLPSVIKEGMGTLAVAIDTSGSINERVLSIFAEELNSICSKMKPEKVVIMYADSSVKNIQECSEDETIVFKPKGGGGTRFMPAIEACNKWDEKPKAMLYFTDMENSDTAEMLEPEYPLLWITGLDVTRTQPFGRIIRIDV